MNWKDELKKLIENGCTDSDIEDFETEHPNVNGKEIWDYVFEYNAPDACKGCLHIQMSGMFPCTMCSRRVEIIDRYVSR